MSRITRSGAARAGSLVAALAALVLSAVAAASALTVVEYYNAALDHYFISPLQPDIDALDSGRLPGWSRTG
jgi:hypothetical protein